MIHHLFVCHFDCDFNFMIFDLTLFECSTIRRPCEPIDNLVNSSCRWNMWRKFIFKPISSSFIMSTGKHAGFARCLRGRNFSQGAINRRLSMSGYSEDSTNILWPLLCPKNIQLTVVRCLELPLHCLSYLIKILAKLKKLYRFEILQYPPNIKQW